MSRLTAAGRRRIPKEDFAGPGDSYPVDTKKRAKAALGLVGMHGTAALKAEVRAKVHRKYPGIKQHDAGRKG